MVGLFSALFFMLGCGAALADMVIDIFPTSTGWRIQDASGALVGNAESQQTIQRLANTYARKGYTVNWRSALPATTGTTAVTTTPRPGSNLPATTVQPGQNLPTTTNGGGSTGGTGGGATTSSAPRVNSANVANAALGAVGMVTGAVGLYESTAGSDKTTWADVGMGAASGATFAAGAAAVVNAIPVAGQIAYGAAVAVGAVIGSMGAGAKMFSESDCEMDPVLGIYACCNISKLSNIDAYRAEIGDKMFTDTFPYVRYCVQGKKEFKEEQPWLKGRFLDDHWSENVEVGLCPGYSMPVNQEGMNIQLYAKNDASVGFCWAWECADPGRTRQGGTCVGSDVVDASMMGPFLPENTEETPVDDANNNGINLVNPVSPTDWDAMDAMIENLPEIGEACKNMDLPQFATAGVYINNGVSVVCAATECKSGTYLVLNSSGVSQGWCVASTYCTNDGEHLNIIDGTKTDLQCVSDANNENNNTNVNAPGASNGAGTENTSTQTTVGNSTGTRNECERGVAGYVMFEGVCMPTAQMQQIQQQRIQAQQQAQQNAVITNLRNQIQRQANIIQDIEDAHSDDKVTVWKDAEGKFNTSRLLSDSIAGVALGTVGGLVVNKVVKDKHVETGFEELSCAIGGETVADFDERFTITGAVNKEQCIGNNVGFGNVYVWAARNSDGTDYSRMVEDINNPDNNACWVRIDIESSNAKLNVSDVPSRWFVVGQQITCGEWTARETLRQRALDARRGARTWATVGGAVGGAGVGVGLMELFGNRLIGGKVMGQKSLDEMELLYSQMSETERREYQAAADKLVELCDELYQKGATSPLCE